MWLVICVGVIGIRVHTCTVRFFLNIKIDKVVNKMCVCKFGYEVCTHEVSIVVLVHTGNEYERV